MTIEGVGNVVDPFLVPIKDGWAALGDGWAVFGRSREEAAELYRVAEEKHAEIRSRPHPETGRAT